jgi:arabinogalactan oligomer/maltooligosaccharide transport system substrate-binding protein
VTERPITTSEPPPQPPIVTVSIWHSWNAAEQQVLDYALRQFQTVHPNVAFMVLYVPKDELLSRYNSAAYRNTGPSILLAPAEWGPAFYDQGLVLDVSEIADPAFLATINSAALDESRYQGALIGLPHSIRSGVVMYRNTQIIPTAPATFDELLVLAQAATGSGKAGAYLDRSFEFSGANLIGVGGRWMDENGRPAFNDRSGLDWMSLLNAYKQAGVAGLNTDRDVQLFKTGKIGIIFESTLRQAELAEAVGEENLSIDPWPAYGGGTLSGFLYTDSIYVNPRTTGDERYNALLVMGFFVAPEVQAIFSTAGHIPVVTEIRLEDAVMQAEVEAFKKATAYPVDPIFAAYPESIRQMLRAIFEQNTDPSAALDLAEQEILNKLNE